MTELTPPSRVHLGSPAHEAFSGAVADSVRGVWRIDVGTGLTSPLVLAGPVLLATTENRLITALSTEDGQLYWERRLEGPIGGSAVHDGTTIYVGTEGSQGRVHALDVARGRRRWRERVGLVGFTPLLVGDALFLAKEDGEVESRLARDGTERWRVDLGEPVAAPPVPHGEDVLVATVRDTLYALNRANGRIRARVELPATVAAAPAVVGDTLVLPLHSGTVLALALPSLEELGRVDVGAAVLAAPVTGVDGRVYVLTDHGDVWRMTPAGREPERVAALGGAARGSLALARDRILVGRIDGALFLLRSDGSVVWRRDLEESIWAPVAVGDDGAVYVPLLGGDIVKLR